MSKEDVEKDYELRIDLALLIYEFPEIAKVFYNNSLKFLEDIEEGVIKIQQQLKEEYSEGSLYRFIVKPIVNKYIIDWFIDFYSLR